MFKKGLCLCLLVASLAACTTRTTHMQVIVPQKIDLAHENLRTAPVVRNVTAEDTAPVFIFIPLGFPNFETVVSDVLKKGGGNAIVNAEIKYITNWYILFGVNKINITGDVVRVGGNKQ